MTRPLATATSAALDKPVLPLAAILYLDILGDPLLCWSGIGDLPFGAAETGDPALDTFTFLGTGTIINIGSISEGVGGSDALEISLPGVDMTQPALRQIVTNRNRWQFRRAIVWLMTLDPDTFAIAGKPFRIKTGRMDRMPYSESDKSGVIKCRIEGQQSYGNTPLATRYSEQPDINPNDISQKFSYSLSNMTASIGQSSAGTGVAAGASGYSGSPANKFFANEASID